MYETDKDRANEERLMNLMAEYTGYQMIKTPPFYVVDAIAIKDGEVKCFFEFKCRENSAQKFPTAAIGMNKVIAAHNLANATKLKVWLVIEWTDKTGFIDMTSEHEIGIITRQDRGTTDLMAMFPISGFKDLNLY
jgi:hypothetical protein